MSQPSLPVLSLDYAKPSEQGSPTWRRIVRIVHWIALAACALGTFVIGLIDTEYGVLAGVVICPAGVLLIIGTIILRDWRSLILGSGHVGVCVLFISLVNLLNWSPDDAHVPMTIMGTIYTIVSASLAVVWGLLWRKADLL